MWVTACWTGISPSGISGPRSRSRLRCRSLCVLRLAVDALLIEKG